MKKSHFSYIKNGDYSTSYGTPEYIAYVISDLTRQHEQNDGCLDEAWEKSLELADRFIDSEFNVSTKSLFECIEEFLKNSGLSKQRDDDGCKMKVADKLRSEGCGKAAFTKQELMKVLTESKGEKSYIIGRHVGTDISGNTIGLCNPYNRDFLIKCLKEEGFKWDFSLNSYGVERINIHL